MSTMTTTATITHVPDDSSHTVLQPFYVLSIVVGSLIGIIITLLLAFACWRRSRTRRRWNEMVTGGWVRPVWRIDESQDEELREMRSRRGPTPVFRDYALNIQEDMDWQKAQPLSLFTLPPSPTQAYSLILHLLGTPSILTPHLFKRIRTIGALRSNKPIKQPPIPKPSYSTSDPSSRVKTEAQVLFLIAMPTPPPLPLSPISPRSTLHQPAPDTIGKEFCLGAVQVLWKKPDDYVFETQEDMDEEEEDDYASMMEARRGIRRQRVFDPSPGQFPHPGAGSMVSDQYIGSYFDDDQSRRNESILPASTYEGPYDSDPHPTQHRYGSSLHVPSSSAPFTHSRPYTPSYQSVRSIPPTLVSVPSQAAPPSNENELRVGSWQSRPELHPGSWDSRRDIGPAFDGSVESGEMGFNIDGEEAETTLRGRGRTAS